MDELAILCNTNLIESDEDDDNTEDISRGSQNTKAEPGTASVDSTTKTSLGSVKDLYKKSKRRRLDNIIQKSSSTNPAPLSYMQSIVSPTFNDESGRISSENAVPATRRYKLQLEQKKMKEIASHSKSIGKSRTAKSIQRRENFKRILKDDKEADVATNPKVRQKKTVLDKMETTHVNRTPLSVLYDCMKYGVKAKVWIRRYAGLRGVVVGYIVAFDLHMNLAMIDVDEVYTIETWMIGQPLPKKKHKNKSRQHGSSVAQDFKELPATFSSQRNLSKSQSNSNPSKTVCSSTTVNYLKKLTQNLKASNISSSMQSEEVSIEKTFEKNPTEDSELKSSNEEESPAISADLLAFISTLNFNVHQDKAQNEQFSSFPIQSLPTSTQTQSIVETAKNVLDARVSRETFNKNSLDPRITRESANCFSGQQQLPIIKGCSNSGTKHMETDQRVPRQAGSKVYPKNVESTKETNLKPAHADQLSKQQKSKSVQKDNIQPVFDRFYLNDIVTITDGEDSDEEVLKQQTNPLEILPKSQHLHPRTSNEDDGTKENPDPNENNFSTTSMTSNVLKQQFQDECSTDISKTLTTSRILDVTRCRTAQPSEKRQFMSSTDKENNVTSATNADKCINDHFTYSPNDHDQRKTAGEARTPLHSKIKRRILKLTSESIERRLSSVYRDKNAEDTNEKTLTGPCNNAQKPADCFENPMNVSAHEITKTNPTRDQTQISSNDSEKERVNELQTRGRDVTSAENPICNPPSDTKLSKAFKSSNSPSEVEIQSKVHLEDNNVMVVDQNDIWNVAMMAALSSVSPGDKQDENIRPPQTPFQCSSSDLSSIPENDLLQSVSSRMCSFVFHSIANRLNQLKRHATLQRIEGKIIKTNVKKITPLYEVSAMKGELSSTDDEANSSHMQLSYDSAVLEAMPFGKVPLDDISEGNSKTRKKMKKRHEKKEKKKKKKKHENGENPERNVRKSSEYHDDYERNAKYRDESKDVWKKRTDIDDLLSRIRENNEKQTKTASMKTVKDGDVIRNVMRDVETKVMSVENIKTKGLSTRNVNVVNASIAENATKEVSKDEKPIELTVVTSRCEMLAADVTTQNVSISDGLPAGKVSIKDVNLADVSIRDMSTEDVAIQNISAVTDKMTNVSKEIHKMSSAEDVSRIDTDIDACDVIGVITKRCQSSFPNSVERSEEDEQNTAQIEPKMSKQQATTDTCDVKAENQQVDYLHKVKSSKSTAHRYVCDDEQRQSELSDFDGITYHKMIAEDVKRKCEEESIQNEVGENDESECSKMNGIRITDETAHETTAISKVENDLTTTDETFVKTSGKCKGKSQPIISLKEITMMRNCDSVLKIGSREKMKLSPSDVPRRENGKSSSLEITSSTNEKESVKDIIKEVVLEQDEEEGEIRSNDQTAAGCEMLDIEDGEIRSDSEEDGEIRSADEEDCKYKKEKNIVTDENEVKTQRRTTKKKQKHQDNTRIESTRRRSSSQRHNVAKKKESNDSKKTKTQGITTKSKQQDDCLTDFKVEKKEDFREKILILKRKKLLSKLGIKEEMKEATNPDSTRKQESEKESDRMLEQNSGCGSEKPDNQNSGLNVFQRRNQQKPHSIKRTRCKDEKKRDENFHVVKPRLATGNEKNEKVANTTLEEKKIQSFRKEDSFVSGRIQRRKEQLQEIQQQQQQKQQQHKQQQHQKQQQKQQQHKQQQQQVNSDETLLKKLCGQTFQPKKPVRGLVFKKRHVNQLFIRGDNIVMVAYEKPSSMERIKCEEEYLKFEKHV